MIDLDRPPGAIAEIKVEPAPVLGHSQVDRTLFSVKQRACLEQLRRGADRLTAWALAGIEVIDAQQKKLEGTRTDRIVLPVSVNANGSPALLVGIVKQLKSRVQGQPDQSVGLGLPLQVFAARGLAEHVFDQVRLLVLLKNRPP